MSVPVRLLALALLVGLLGSPPALAQDAAKDLALKALAKATGPFLQAGDDAKEEPIGEIARLYRLQDLDLTMAACELDIAKPDDLKAMIAGNKKLRELGLAPLQQAGGAVKRGDWKRVGATSLMQRVSREIERGSPFNVTK